VGLFCWTALRSPDLARSRAFYSEVVGWSFRAQDMGGHGRGRGFSVHPADHHSLLAGHHGGQDFGSACHRFFKSQRRIKGRIAGMDRGRKNHQFGIVNEAGAVGRLKVESFASQTFDFLGVDLVRTTDTMTERQKKSCNATHPGTGYSDEVDAT
jgi:catechol 2,3-dioxygenase-like lactoylglutathione lyase family enzyme